jgi:hypothetical protein
MLTSVHLEASLVYRLMPESNYRVLIHSIVDSIRPESSRTLVLIHLVISIVTGEDAGNTFFLQGSDIIGRSGAEETVRLLGELTDIVQGKARSLEDVLGKDKRWLGSFTIVIAHNLKKKVPGSPSSILWHDPLNPPW